MYNNEMRNHFKEDDEHDCSNCFDYFIPIHLVFNDLVQFVVDLFRCINEHAHTKSMKTHSEREKINYDNCACKSWLQSLIK